METRTLRVDMNELEFAFETKDDPFRNYLDTQTGEVLAVPGYAYDGDVDDEMEAAAEAIDADPERFLRLESDVDLRPSLDDAGEFVLSVEDERFRERLNAALAQHRGAFRRFLDVLHEEAGEIERWRHASRQRLRENIATWLAAQGIHVLYEPLPADPPRHDVRRHLLAGAATFIERVKRIRGVQRIALVGSITTPKRSPNDVDLLLTINGDASIPDIAAAGRKLKGHTQTMNRGADIFLANAAGQYLGRTCPWRECGPGIRRSCEARNCGGHLYDDLHVLKLSDDLIAAPPLVIWPEAVVRDEVPPDVVEVLELR